MNIEKFRVPQKSKNQLVTLKRTVGIENWNILCRWALCLSLSEPSEPTIEYVAQDSNIEMTWRTFGGPLSDVYRALVHHRYTDSTIRHEVDELSYFLLHLKRGVSYLHDRLKGQNIATLIHLVEDSAIAQ